MQPHYFTHYSDNTVEISSITMQDIKYIKFILLVLILNKNIVLCNGDFEEKSSDEVDVGEEDEVSRNPRYYGSTEYYGSNVINVMKNTVFDSSFNKDVFSFLRDDYEPTSKDIPWESYDFIIVGAGSAGSVLASRLSEDRKTSVLVIEAGVGECLLTDVPILAPVFQRTSYVWPYLMEKQPGVCMGMTEERCYWPRGKAVGGSSVVNYMIYTRGLAVDWDRIADDGNYGWSYNDVLPYYMKSERANLKGFNSSEYIWHGRDGELSVEFPPFRSKLSKAFLDAAKILGNKIVDYNSPTGFGFNFIQSTTSKGRRHSSAKAFLHSHKRRKNIHILTNSQATKVLIDPQSKIAYGVEFYRKGKLYQLLSKKEVILSAGPIESPHLLMLSGVGPKDHLESFNIPVIEDLKVGELLYDHIAFPALAFTVNRTGLTLADKKISTARNAIDFTQFGDGPFSSLAGVETIGYIRTNISNDLPYVPDIELLGSCASLASDGNSVVGKGIHMTDWLYNSVYKEIEKIESFTIIPMLIHPKSCGTLKLRSNNPFDQPKLYGNYLTHPDDTATLIASVRYILQLVKTEPFQKYGVRLHKKKFPNCKEYKFNSDAYWECALRTLTTTLHHQIATCKMGPNTDPYAVVDPELRVYGVNNLRVIDSSVIPRTIAAHTNAPAIMIGEKGAEFIKRDWGLH